MSDHPPVAGPPAAHSPPPRHRQARWIWYRAGPQTDRAIYSPQNPQHLLKMWCDKSCVGLGVRAAVWFTSSLRWWLLCREHGNSGLPMTGKSHFSKGWVLNTHTPQGWGRWCGRNWWQIPDLTSKDWVCTSAWSLGRFGFDRWEKWILSNISFTKTYFYLM